MPRSLFFCFLVFFSFPILLHGQVKQVQGKVIKIIDGDTFDVVDSAQKIHRIRLYGIDCPENGQDFAQVSKRYTSSLTFQNKVVAKVLYKDRYKRAVAKVYVDGIEVNLSLLEQGLAWHHLAYDQSELYAKAQQNAQKLKQGLWIQNNAKSPWEYRQMRRNQNKK